jgi:hypothetical protein
MSWDGWMIVNDEFQGLWKEVVMAYFKIISASGNSQEIRARITSVLDLQI